MSIFVPHETEPYLVEKEAGGGREPKIIDLGKSFFIAVDVNIPIFSSRFSLLTSPDNIYQALRLKKPLDVEGIQVSQRKKLGPSVNSYHVAVDYHRLPPGTLILREAFIRSAQPQHVFDNPWYALLPGRQQWDQGGLGRPMVTFEQGKIVGHSEEQVIPFSHRRKLLENSLKKWPSEAQKQAHMADVKAMNSRWFKRAERRINRCGNDYDYKLVCASPVPLV